MLLFAEIAIDVVFAAALLSALGSLVYLVTLALRERHLRPGFIGRASQIGRQPAPAAPTGTQTQPRRALLHRG